MKIIAAASDDLAALGAMAPLRAVYEAGKRSGAQGLALRSLANMAKPVSLKVVAEFRPSRPVPDSVADRCLNEAQRIIDEGHRVFGSRVPINGPGDWNALGDTGKRWPVDRYWWQIDIRTHKRLGDVKWTWELGRHRDIVVLARAAFLERDGKWLDALAQRLRWWFESTPAERGIHWYSNLEIALRAIAWTQVYALSSESLPRDVLDDMALHISHARRHLLVDFPYTASSMRNNHLLGDSLGLLVIQRFTAGKPARWLSHLAESSFAGQIKRHVMADGSMIEDSLSYHRFVVEMLAVKVLLGDRADSTLGALQGAAQHLERLGALDGSLPQWGDWDEGRVLASSGDELDVAGSTALGLALTDTAADPTWWEEFDEVAWYAPPPLEASGAEGTATGPTDNEASVSVASNGGITRVCAGDWTVWFKCGTGPSHQHADLTHVSARFRDQWVLIDPGTGTYNGELEIRNAFRTSRAHNGLRIHGEEMFVPHRAFRWLTSANTCMGMPVQAKDVAVVWGLHDAYTRLEDGGRVARAVVVTRDGLTCVDWREGDKESLLTIALPPEAQIADGRLSLGTPNHQTPDLALTGLEGTTITNGAQAPFGGSFSRTYGCWQPAPWLEQAISGSGPTTWGVAIAGATNHTPTTDGTVVHVAGVDLSLEFRPGGATLSATFLGKTRLFTAGEEHT
jgi:hypothetical protein